MSLEPGRLTRFIRKLVARPAGRGMVREIAPGAWTWFNDPRAIVVNETVWVGAVAQNGDIHVSAGQIPTVLHHDFEQDDHDNPAFLRRASDGRIIVCYSRHAADNNYYQRVSLDPDDVSAFGAEKNISPSIGGALHTYANLVEIEDGIFNFLRCISGGGMYTPHFTVSRDNGDSWQTVTKLLLNSGHRPYFKLTKNGANRIDLICTDGHPAEMPDGNSIYHFYYLDGDWYKSDGKALGPPPFMPASLTRIYDGLASPRGWVWDVKADSSGRPVAVFATFPKSATDHRYRYARWDGAAWISHEICAAGGTVYPPGDEREPYYSGGICIDPEDVNTIYCSRESEDRDASRDRGIFQLWKGVTRDGGASWKMTQLTSGLEDCIRPVKLSGSNELLCVRGKYHSYTSYSTSIAALSL